MDFAMTATMKLTAEGCSATFDLDDGGRLTSFRVGDHELLVAQGMDVLGSRPDNERLHAQPRCGPAYLRARLRPIWPQACHRVRCRAVCGREPRLRGRAVVARAVDFPLSSGARHRQHRDDLR